MAAQLAKAALDWATLIRALCAGLEQPSKQWTLARRRESLRRVLDGSASDEQRLHQRLTSLCASWGGEADAPPEVDATDEGGVAVQAVSPATVAAPKAATQWPQACASLDGTIQAALASHDLRARQLADALAQSAGKVTVQDASASAVAELEKHCLQARRFFSQRHRLVDELGQLCVALGAGMADLAEDQSWAQGQGLALQARLQDGINLRGVRAAQALLAQARVHQKQLRGQRNEARDALKAVVQKLLAEVSALDAHTEHFHDAMGRHALAVQGATSLQELADVVSAMLADSLAVKTVVAGTRQRLADEEAQAQALQARVHALESELRRASDEATTDALTQVANRRGLQASFDTEVARAKRAAPEAPGLALALIDIDNFKRLNDTLGHAAGDVALKSLAQAVRQRLRPGDHFARFGGEEFVVVLPSTPTDEAQNVITRLQRSLSASLFLHENKEVFVTFSAGVTAWRAGEALEVSLDRADEALYEAKRTGKNRTCVA